MSIRSSKSERYDLIVFEAFEFKGAKRHKAHRVGSAKASAKDGFVLYVPAGIALTGRIMMVPEKASFTEVDLLEAYHSAADEHGL